MKHIIPRANKLLKIGGKLIHRHIYRHSNHHVHNKTLSRHGGTIIKPGIPGFKKKFVSL